MLRFLLLTSLFVCVLGAAPRLRRPRLDGRIIGGVDADIEDYPYQLSVEYSNSHICGAAIISANWVVTAAQCVDGLSPSRVQFRAGSSIRGKGGSVHLATQLIAHPLYDYYTIDFDVAVVRVSVPFAFGVAVQPISLIISEPAAGEYGVVTGWGTLSSGTSELSTLLQAVNVTIASREECNAAYSVFGGITEHMICAGSSGGGKGACQGDSGGPLAVRGELAGIVSWGGGCAQDSYPGVYTSVASLRDFITEQAGVK
ncbi:trypsin-2 [Cryptotermes secundus]|uniref:trypsin-2 n=1 Tax=Cryptotermes secundus TaxID=105785 RepID=UPI000CD7B02E|nr:trypsin-2 [Cryptotermes secundus]